MLMSSLSPCVVYVYAAVYNAYKMAEDKTIPIILDGTFFKIVKELTNKVIAKCVNCVNNELSGSRHATSNFLRHLKVRNTHNIFLAVSLCILCSIYTVSIRGKIKGKKVITAEQKKEKRSSPQK